MTDPFDSPPWRRWSRLLPGAVAGVLAATVAVNAGGLLAPDRGLEPGTVRVLSGLDVSAGRQRGQLAEQWNATHPGGPRVEIVETTGDADEQYAQALALAQEGDAVPAGERVDVFNLDVTWTAQFASAGHLLPLDDADTTGFLTGPLSTGAYDGHRYALPFNTDAGLLYYRGDLIEAAPATWDDLAARGAEILADPAVREANPHLAAGTALQLADYEGMSVNVLEWVWAHGGDIGGGEESLAADEKTVAALDELDARLAPDTGGEPLILRDSLRFREADSLAAFAEGRTVFLRHWPYAYRELLRAGMHECGGPAPSFCVARLPGPSVLGGQNLAVSAHTDQPRAARAVVEFLTGARSQQLLFERGGFAATREIVYRDAEVLREYPYASLLLDAVTSARPRPETPRYQRYSETLRARLHGAFAGPDRADLAALGRDLAAIVA